MPQRNCSPPPPLPMTPPPPQHHHHHHLSLRRVPSPKLQKQSRSHKPKATNISTGTPLHQKKGEYHNNAGPCYVLGPLGDVVGFDFFFLFADEEGVFFSGELAFPLAAAGGLFKPPASPLATDAPAVFAFFFFLSVAAGEAAAAEEEAAAPGSSLFCFIVAGAGVGAGTAAAVVPACGFRVGAPATFLPLPFLPEGGEERPMASSVGTGLPTDALAFALPSHQETRRAGRASAFAQRKEGDDEEMRYDMIISTQLPSSGICVFIERTMQYYDPSISISTTNDSLLDNTSHAATRIIHTVIFRNFLALCRVFFCAPKTGRRITPL